MTYEPEYYSMLSREIGMTSIAPSIDLKDRVVLITGGADGIGGALSEAMTLYGGSVIAIGRQEEKLRKMENKLGSDKFVGLQCDLMKPIEKSFKNVLTEVCERFGIIDAYVMNAGAQKICEFANAKDLISTPVSEFRNLMELNGLSHLDLFQTLYPYLKESKAGRILATTSSVVGRNDLKIGAYIISKSDLTNLTGLMQNQMTGTNVLVNAYAPPPVETWLRADYEKDEPLNANALPEDVIELPLRLISADLQHDNKLFLMADKRSDAKTDAGIPYKFNKRTERGFNFDIIVRSPLNTGSKLEGSKLIENYDTCNSRQLTGYGPLPPIDQSKPLRSVLTEPPHLTQIRKTL